MLGRRCHGKMRSARASGACAEKTRGALACMRTPPHMHDAHRLQCSTCSASAPHFLVACCMLCSLPLCLPPPLSDGLGISPPVRAAQERRPLADDAAAGGVPARRARLQSLAAWRPLAVCSSGCPLPAPARLHAPRAVCSGTARPAAALRPNGHASECPYRRCRRCLCHRPPCCHSPCRGRPRRCRPRRRICQRPRRRRRPHRRVPHRRVPHRRARRTILLPARPPPRLMRTRADAHASLHITPAMPAARRRCSPCQGPKLKAATPAPSLPPPPTNDAD